MSKEEFDIVELVASEKNILMLQVDLFKKRGYRLPLGMTIGKLKLEEKVSKARKDNGFSDFVFAIIMDKDKK